MRLPSLVLKPKPVLNNCTWKSTEMLHRGSEQMGQLCCLSLSLEICMAENAESIARKHSSIVKDQKSSSEK